MTDDQKARWSQFLEVWIGPANDADPTVTHPDAYAALARELWCERDGLESSIKGMVKKIPGDFLGDPARNPIMARKLGYNDALKDVLAILADRKTDDLRKSPDLLRAEGLGNE